jgi:hypothetical protein
MRRLRRTIDSLNSELFNPAGLNILWPHAVAFLFVRLPSPPPCTDRLSYDTRSWRSNITRAASIYLYTVVHYPGSEIPLILLLHYTLMQSTFLFRFEAHNTSRASYHCTT